MTIYFRRWGGSYSVVGGALGSPFEDWTTGPSGTIISGPNVDPNRFADGCFTYSPGAGDTVCSLFLAKKHTVQRAGSVISASLGIRPGTTTVPTSPTNFTTDRLVAEIRADDAGGAVPGTLLDTAYGSLAITYDPARATTYRNLDEARFAAPVGPFAVGATFWLVVYPELVTNYPKVSGNAFWSGVLSLNATDGYASGVRVTLTGNTYAGLTAYRRHSVAGGPVYSFYPNSTDPHMIQIGPIAGYAVDSDNTLLPAMAHARRDLLALKRSSKLYISGAIWDHTVTHSNVALGGGGGYTVGGYDLTNKNAEVYDPSTGLWTSLANATDPLILSHFGVESAGNLIVAGGVRETEVTGASSTDSPTNHVQVYNFTADTWTAGTAMPVRLRSGSFFMYNNLLHIMGGRTNVALNDTIYRYSGGTGGTWASPTSNPYGATQVGSGPGELTYPWLSIYGSPGDPKYGALLNSANKLYLFPFNGGRGFISYDLPTATWANLTPIPHTRGTSEATGDRVIAFGARLVASDGRVWIFNSDYGGVQFGGQLLQSQDTWVYDPAVPSWTQMANTPEPGYGPVIEHTDGYFYYFGLSHAIWRYDPVLDDWSDSGQRIAAYDELIPYGLSSGTDSRIVPMIPVGDGAGGYWLVYARANELGSGSTAEGRGSVPGGASLVEHWIPGSPFVATRRHTWAAVIG